MPPKPSTKNKPSVPKKKNKKKPSVPKKKNKPYQLTVVHIQGYPPMRTRYNIGEGDCFFTVSTKHWTITAFNF